MVDTNHLDFVDNEGQRRDLVERIEEHPGGTVYYQPLAGEEGS